MVGWDFLSALRARWLLIAVITCTVLGVVAVWCATSTRLYTAASTLLFDTAQSDPTAPRAGGGQASSMGTQADIIRSSLVAQRVIENLKMAQSPDIIRRYQSANVGSVPLTDWLARRLTSPSALQVLPTKSTSVMAINYVATDPDFASLMANAFADAYVQIQLQLKTDPAKVYSQWFESQIREYRGRLEAAQQRLTAFQQEKGLIGAQRIDIESSRLAELSAQLTNVQGQRANANSLANSNVSQSGAAQMSGLVQSLDGQIAGKSASIQQMRESYGPNHPALVAAQAELAELRTKRGQAVGTAVTAARVGSVAAQAQEGEVRSLLEAQRARVLRLSGVQDQMAVFQRDVDTAKSAYDAVTTRLNQVRLQSQIPQTNVSLLDHAVSPTLPSSPNIPIRVALGLIVGLMAGFGLALLMEWINPRVRSARGLAVGTLVPVLADLGDGAPRRRRLLAIGSTR